MNQLAWPAQRGDRGPWIQTYTGKAFYPLDPDPDDICIEDIAHSLSLKCRYGGHCIRFYSVAEHSILVSRNCGEHQLEALLHDASEVYLCDVPSPIKHWLKGYAWIETLVEAAIADRFGLTWPWPSEIHEIDKRIQIDEACWNMAEPDVEWLVHPGGGLGLAYLPCWKPDVAEQVFLQVFTALGGR